MRESGWVIRIRCT